MTIIAHGVTSGIGMLHSADVALIATIAADGVDWFPVDGDAIARHRASEKEGER